ncbi:MULTISPECIES: inorganic phosphate transporter [unclassified Archaeoglobus]|jgi:PiT family inorganic phosphate transporter|uniref:inorganic phosphate transporter n=1 Tax=unclassified Archaeoglobus TaxID=2643606 RepID=UPI0025C4527E|nr:MULTISPECIES: inorganic phosphate transporter [unclassified Archaeoglobus]
MDFSLPLLAAFAIAFAIGSNDTSNSFGICVGCGLLTIRRAIYLLFILVFFGLLLGGSKVLHTVGGEIVEPDEVIVSISLLVSSAAIVAANYLRTPVSSHQAIVMSLIGSAFALGKEIEISTVIKIVLSWIISPFGALVSAIAIYWLMEKSLSKRPLLQVERVLRILLIIGASIIGFNTGANELATALAPAIWFGTMNLLEGAIFGSAMLFLGAWLVSVRVAEVVGKGITALDPFSGFAAQFAAGITVLVFTFLGMPVSTTYCTVGAITGVGLYKGLSGVKFAFIKRIVASWMLTPATAFIASFATTTLVHQLIL